MSVFSFLRKFKKQFSSYQTSVNVFIHQNHILHNLKAYREKYPKLDFAPVLKSNAYGHGLVQVAKIIDKEKLPFIVLDSLYEANVLKREGVKNDILVVGHFFPENLKKNNLKGLAFTVTDIAQLESIVALKLKIKIHLKIDTGMHRQGIEMSMLEKACSLIKASKRLELVGVLSHFADADGENDAFTFLQLREWEKAVKYIKDNFPKVKYFHLANTAGSFYIRDKYSNVGRLGLGLYGINPSPYEAIDLKPALEMKSVIGSLRNIKEGEAVGYNMTYRAEKEMSIATVPVGYFEGVDRRLSNKSYFKIGEVFCPILGRVSMNITSIDVSLVPNLKWGDEVTIISSNTEDKNSILNIAKEAETIPYEILVHIPQHLRRIVI